MHGYYKDMVKNGEDPRAHPPSNMRSTEDWEWLCDNIFKYKIYLFICLKTIFEIKSI